MVSIIGIDRFGGGYNAAKRVHEQAYLDGSVPVKILRAAQFHEFVGQLVDWGTQNGTRYLPEMRTQLVAARTVGRGARRRSRPAPTRPEIPSRRPARGVAGRGGAAARGPARRAGARRGRRHPARTARCYAAGALLPGPDATLAGPTFEEWLASC